MAFFFNFLLFFYSKQAVAMAAGWVKEEEDALWQHFESGPECVVSVLPRQKAVQQKNSKKNQKKSPQPLSARSLKRI